jgi:hypothetical protein
MNSLIDESSKLSELTKKKIEFVCTTFTGNIKNYSGLNRLMKSCKRFEIKFEMTGSKTFSWTEKIQATRDSLMKLRDIEKNGQCWNGLVLVCDAFDVRILCGEDEIIRKFNEMIPDSKKILFCGERENSHQTQIMSDETSTSVYKNFSTSMILGQRSLIVSMLNEVLEMITRNQLQKTSPIGCRCGPRPQMLCDQWYVAQWADKNREKVLIDEVCNIFWSTRGESKDFSRKFAEPVRDEITRTKRLLNRTTRTKPCILHSPCP